MDLGWSKSGPLILPQERRCSLYLWYKFCLSLSLPPRKKIASPFLLRETRFTPSMDKGEEDGAIKERSGKGEGEEAFSPPPPTFWPYARARISIFQRKERGGEGTSCLTKSKEWSRGKWDEMGEDSGDAAMKFLGFFKTWLRLLLLPPFPTSRFKKLSQPFASTRPERPHPKFCGPLCSPPPPPTTRKSLKRPFFKQKRILSFSSPSRRGLCETKK